MLKNIKFNCRNQRLAAFTLIEMLFVLWLTSFILGLPLYLEQQQANRLQEQYFLHNWLEYVHYAQITAITKKIRTDVRYESENQQILIFLDGRLQHQKLNVPRTVWIKNAETISFKAESGHIRKIVRIEMKLEKSQREIQIQFQIGSGRYQISSANSRRAFYGG